MPRIHYIARTLTGDRVEGNVRASSEQDARDKLSRDGLEVLEIRSEQGREKSVHGEPSLSVRTSSLVAMTGQLALMLETGTALVDSIEALEKQSSDTRLTVVLRTLAHEVSGGSTLASALAKHPRVFDGFYISAVQAGEASGSLADVFKRLEVYLQKRLDLRMNIVTALIYPIIVSILAIVAVVFILTFVLPKFVTIFERSGVLLPLPTRMLMGLSSFIVSYWYLLLLAIAGIVTGIYFYVKSPKGSLMIDWLILQLPILGSLARMIQSTVLLRTMGTLLDAGVTLVDTLDIAQSACRNSLFRQFARDISKNVVRGQDLASSFDESDLVSPTIKQMVRTGEQTGTLAPVLNSVCDHLDAAVDKQTKRLSAIFEPMIIIVMGIVIGFIAVSVLLPLFRLSRAAKGG